MRALALLVAAGRIGGAIGESMLFRWRHRYRRALPCR